MTRSVSRAWRHLSLRLGRPLFFLQCPLEIDDMGADIVEPRVKPQSAAEGLQGGNAIVQLQVALAHPRGGGEMVGVDLERLMAVADRFVEFAQIEMGQRALVP